MINMILTETALAEIDKTETRLKLALELKVTEQAVIRYIKENKYNGPLTKAAAQKVIMQETNFNFSEILTESPIKSIS
jgi:hypothetical protein